jgi:hypothetical protein
MRKLRPISIMLLLTSALFAQDVNVIVNKMTAAHQDARAKLRAYQTTRHYQIFKGTEKKSDVTAEVNYLPPQEKSFSITKSTGGTGERVVKKTLEHEVVATRSPREYEVSLENYDFAYLGEEPCNGSYCYVLQIKPKRECKDLIDGHIWVDKSTYLIHKLAGELAKSPSWWVKKAFVTVEYGAIDGMWLQKLSIADAKLRMIGDYRLISRDVELRSARTVASVPQRSSLRRRSLAAGAIVSESAFFLPRK